MLMYQHNTLSLRRDIPYIVYVVIRGAPNVHSVLNPRGATSKHICVISTFSHIHRSKSHFGFVVMFSNHSLRDNKHLQRLCDRNTVLLTGRGNIILIFPL